jgi:hypothetical protein
MLRSTERALLTMRAPRSMKISKTKLPNPGHFLCNRFLLNLPAAHFSLHLSHELTPLPHLANLHAWQRKLP